MIYSPTFPFEYSICRNLGRRAPSRYTTETQPSPPEFSLLTRFPTQDERLNNWLSSYNGANFPKEGGGNAGLASSNPVTPEARLERIASTKPEREHCK
jgi:hypothetical protein